MDNEKIILKEILRAYSIRYFDKQSEYWELKSNKRKRNKFFYFLLSLKFLRLFICFIYWKISYYFSNYILKKNGHYILLTRSKGIRSYHSLEDYRFKGLSKKLSKQGQIYFFINGEMNNINFSLHPRVYINDFIYLAEFLIFGFNLKSLSKELVWEQDAQVLNKSSYIIALLLSNEFNIFFWDFYTDHCPLILGGLRKNCKLVGSIHAFTQKNVLPWIEKDWILAKLIKHNFISYKEIFNNKSVNNYVNQIKVESSFVIKNKLEILVLIEENYTLDENGLKRYFSIEWASKNKSYFKKIFIKVRRDNAFTKDFLDKCSLMGISDFTLIKDIDKNLYQKIFVVGSYSSYLLELASKKILCSSVSNLAPPPFMNPAWELVEIYKYDSSSDFIIENPLNFNTKSIFLSSNFNNFKFIPSKACINHLVFRKYVVDAIYEEIN